MHMEKPECQPTMAISPSPSRQVLGWKTTNASIKQGVLEVNNKHITVTKASIFEQVSKDRVNLPRAGSPRIGQKRSIAQVDGTEQYDRPPLQQRGSPLLPTTEDKQENAVMVEDDDETKNEGQNVGAVKKGEEDDNEPSTAESKTTTTSLTSFHASQEGPVPLEEQFIIQEETSQNTLENLNVTPLPQNTSHPQLHSNPTPPTDGSQDSMRMSSFVDFEAAGAEDEDLKMILPKRTSSPTCPDRKTMIAEKVEILRTRLQLAAYKVKTNQTKTPFFWLHGPQSSPERLRMPLIKREEGVISAARRQATGQSKSAVRHLNSLPMPTIVPTAYSARYMVPAREGIPSSPPTSTSSEDLGISSANTLTPTDCPRARRSPIQLSSPTPSQADSAALQRMSSSGDVTSGVVKTEAANGLLDLIRAAAVS
ncbi:hypothetical protein EPUS_07521 [Endocarpon pusillum Z07020]|uniref:Uncharacterized protein n=1 Tax=Endocarpon pusillum (strain Z07020 / HMAS-L-300199) TaxID=1263415 RepID=U1G822_ENDPU|nr:uncharacterized protein EPUS_07521 [Endocarpon pusillum Z07020]ERF73587.1 hypothetical protein EPUS_07521 [Endocarpon pusillum Z07020]